MPESPVPPDTAKVDSSSAPPGKQGDVGEPHEARPGEQQTDDPLPASTGGTAPNVRTEHQDGMKWLPPRREDFLFKIATVKWFCILCAAVILLTIAANAFFINKLFTVAAAHQAGVQFQGIVAGPVASERSLELAVENEALNMRNKRTVSALFMRAYVQFLSITAGTILALFGAVFVLARVDSPITKAEATWKDFRWLVNTASPGILIAIIGAALVAFVTHRSISQIEAKDLPVFGTAMLLAAEPAIITQSDEFKNDMARDLQQLKEPPQ